MTHPQETGKSKEQEAAEMRAQVRKDYTLPPAWSETEDYLQIYAEWYHEQRDAWIKIEEDCEMPRGASDVLLAIKVIYAYDTKIVQGYNFKGIWIDIRDGNEVFPTHWRNLPAPPKH